MAVAEDGHTERSPLLGDQNGSAVNSHAEEQGDSQVEAGVPPVETPSTKKLLLIVGSVWIGVFLGALDATIIATLASPISNEFESFTLLSWLASAYLIANAALQPLSGRLTDIYGRRNGLVFSNIFFAAGNLICGLAQTEATIIIGRVVAGMGGGGLMAISTFVLSDLVPLRQRGVWQGIGNCFFGLGAGLGGIFGGWMNDAFNWRWAFLIQVPFVLVSAVLVFFTIDIPIKKSETSKLKRVDFLGAFTLVCSLVLLLIGLNSGGNLVPWTHPLVLTTLPLAIVFLGLFVYVEDRIASEPIIPVRLLLDRTCACACLTLWFQTMSVWIIVYYGPIYFQVRGYSASQAGLRLIPNSIGASIGSLGAGFVMRVTGRYYWLTAILVSIVVAASALITGTFDRNTPDAPPFIYFAMAGFGYAGMLTTTLLALISAVDHTNHSVITSASYAFRSTGSTIGITIASAVFQNVVQMQLQDRFSGYPDADRVIARLRDSVDYIKQVPDGWYDGVMDSYIGAFRATWFASLGLAILGAVISLGMREHKLHSNLERK